MIQSEGSLQSVASRALYTRQVKQPVASSQRMEYPEMTSQLSNVDHGKAEALLSVSLKREPELSVCSLSQAFGMNEFLYLTTYVTPPCGTPHG